MLPHLAWTLWIKLRFSCLLARQRLTDWVISTALPVVWMSTFLMVNDLEHLSMCPCVCFKFGSLSSSWGFKVLCILWIPNHCQVYGMYVSNHVRHLTGTNFSYAVSPPFSLPKLTKRKIALTSIRLIHLGLKLFSLTLSPLGSSTSALTTAALDVCAWMMVSKPTIRRSLFP